MPTQYILSKENIADIATRSETTISMLGPESLWQAGPHWLFLLSIQWPNSRLVAKEEFLDNECKNRFRILSLITKHTSLRCPFVVDALKMCNDYYNELKKVIKILLDICLQLVSQRYNYALDQMPTLSNSEASHRDWSLFFENAILRN